MALRNQGYPGRRQLLLAVLFVFVFTTARIANVAAEPSASGNLGLRVEPFSRSQKAVKGAGTNMTCRGWSRDGSGNITVDWYFKDRRLSMNNPPAGTSFFWAEKRVAMTSFTRLTIRHASLKHGGQYKCIVRTLDGSKELADHMFLHIVLPPKMDAIRGDVPQANVALKTGENLRLDCVARAFPAAKVQWLYNGAILPSKDGRVKQIMHKIRPDARRERVHVSGASLVVLGFNELDAGLYRCIAQNEAGNATRAINAIVVAKPVIVSQESFYAREGQNISLSSFKVIGAPPLELGAERRPLTDSASHPARTIIRFGHTGKYRLVARQERVDTVRIRLDIDRVTLSDTGHYHFSIHNKGGAATLEVRLFVLPNHLQRSRRSHRSEDE